METHPARPDRNTPLGPDYRLVREIGQGGYGSVYLCARNGGPANQYFAAKFVYRNFFGPEDDPASAGAYRRALDGLRNFRSVTTESQYLLRVFEVHHRHEAGFFCYTMELADDLHSGPSIDPHHYTPRTLKHELERSGERRRLPARYCVEIGGMLARGLRILHESGFTHRDVRPSNIIFVHGLPKLADIDLLAEHDPALTSYIPRHYAAPEGAHTTQADLYSFGKTLYEMCTGLPVRAFPVLPKDVRLWADHPLLLQLNKIVAKACAPDLRKRYASAGQLVSDLEDVGDLSR